MRVTLTRLVAGVVLCFATLMQAIHLDAKPVSLFFLVTDGLSKKNNFVIALVDPIKIQMARRIIAGNVTDQIHVSGKIVKGHASYNSRWKFYLDPKSIDFFTFANTTCGRGFNTSDIQANLNLVGKPGSPLAAGFWCPLGSKVVAELKS
jgi:hypothetical protein